MARFSVDIPDELDTWLERQAELNSRSKNKHICHLLTQVMRDNAGPRYLTNSALMCSAGHHRFVKAEPAVSDFCNCGFFVYGEVVR